MNQPICRRCDRCRAILATDNTDRVCAPCRTNANTALLNPPVLPPEFWQTEQMRSALASWHMGKIIRAYRRHPNHDRTLPQELVAGWLNLTQAQLSRIEAGRAPQDLHKLVHWAQTLGIPANLLWFRLPTVPRHEGPTTSRRVVTTLSAGHEIVDRINFALRNPASADFMTAAYLRTEIQHLDEEYVRVPSTTLLARTGQLLNQTAFLANHARSGRVRRELHVVAAEAAVLMGQLVWDAAQRREHESARAYFEQAISHARHCDDRSLESLALLRSSMLALYGANDPRAGLQLVVQSSDTARPVSHVLEGLAHLHAAEAQAILQDVAACEKALSEAETAFCTIDETDAAIDQYSTALFGRMAGSSYLHLNRPARAITLLSEAAAQSREPSKAKAVLVGNLALASVRQGNLDEAIGYLHQSIDIIEVTRAGGGLNLAFSVGRDVRPWRQAPAVHDVYDRLLSLTSTS